MVKARKEQLGSDHPDTISSMDDLALTYSNQGRWNEAKELQLDVVKARKSKFGSDHNAAGCDSCNKSKAWC